MALEPVAGPQRGRTFIRNVGLMLSGDLARPVLEADALVVQDGIIAAIGRGAELQDHGPFDMVVDAHGCALSPGLIDSHVHPVFGDWTPRQNQIGWVESFLHGGVTTMVSAGEVHLPGRPKDIVGLKALAITAQRAFFNLRPAGSGVQPLGILRLVSLLASLGGIKPELALACATGNTARIRNLDAGLLEVGRAADLVFLDRAQHTAGRDLLDSIRLGDIPGIGMVMIDGAIRAGRSRNTPPAERVPELLGH